MKVGRGAVRVAARVGVDPALATTSATRQPRIISHAREPRAKSVNVEGERFTLPLKRLGLKEKDESPFILHPSTFIFFFNDTALLQIGIVALAH